MTPGKDPARRRMTGESAPLGCTVRRATAVDAALLASLGERTFREAWAAFNDPADMDAYCGAHFSTGSAARDLERAAVRLYIAAVAGEAAGYLRTEAGPAPACVRADAPAEVSRMYVLGRWHGHGVAHALMEAALESLSAQGHDAAWLAVWQQAGRALAFYRKWGFANVGTTTFRLGEDLQDDFVLQRPLKPAGRGGSPSQ